MLTYMGCGLAMAMGGKGRKGRVDVLSNNNKHPAPMESGFFALLAWPRLVMEDQISGDHALVVLSRLLLVLASAGGG
jgi:hypothetical protein